MLHYPNFNNHNKLKDLHSLLNTRHYSIYLRNIQEEVTKTEKQLVQSYPVISNAARIQIKSVLSSTNSEISESFHTVTILGL